jgi:hypothetical protein
MKKQLLLLSIFLLLGAGGNTGSERISLSSGSADTKVAICTGSSSRRYHSTHKCKGLSNCKSDKT